MKDHRSSSGRHVMVASLALAVAFAPAAAQHTLTFTTASRVAIEGSSNVHKWTCVSGSVGGTVSSPQAASSDVGKSVTSMTVDIPVNSLDCGHGDMNNNLRKAMNQGAHPGIRFRMTSYDATPHAGAYDAIMNGVLTINGVDKPVQLHATVTPNGSGGAGVVGSVSLDTEDYGVKPVRLFMGTLRTSPDVTITFRLSAVRS
jgi:polyisoprenoid-binding protein YceI